MRKCSDKVHAKFGAACCDFVVCAPENLLFRGTFFCHRCGQGADMCGIAGLWTSHGWPTEELAAVADAMSRPIHHRGPDDGGNWTNPRSGVAFGFRRLAIIDLSPRGHQPMSSPSGRYTIVFNGEIYNHPELSAELSALGHSFRGHSDTEVALAAFEEWGIHNAVTRFVGMFAMAIWDEQRRTLTLVRDRVGIKPLFVYARDGLVAFASELKSLVALPGFRPEIDVSAAAAFFRYLYVPAPWSIYRGVTKLMPGHLLEIQAPAAKLPPPRSYWSLTEVAAAGHQNQLAGSDAEIVDAVEAAILDAIRLRLRADVPIGAFLSGGIDSSTLVALMQEASPQRVRTFTIGFDVRAHDESKAAAAIARHLGTDHQVLHLGGRDALELVPALPKMFDEPLADPSQIPTYLICSAAREDVTVALSGDGGDELFAGYNRYVYGSGAITRAARVPAHLRRPVGRGLTVIDPRSLDRAHQGLSRLGVRGRLVGEKVHKLGNLLRQPDASSMYRSLVSAWQEPPVVGSTEHPNRGPSLLDHDGLTLLDRMMLTDQQHYLPDDLLAKVDRTSMAVSLEVRVPLLDHRVVELSWRLPQHAKIREGVGKWALREVLYRRVPKTLLDRPKTGFSVPLSEWLRGPLRQWADDRLDPERLSEVPWLDGQRVRRVWSDFLSGGSQHSLAIWTILSFEAWRDHWVR